MRVQSGAVHPKIIRVERLTAVSAFRPAVGPFGSLLVQLAVVSLVLIDTLAPKASLTVLALSNGTPLPVHGLSLLHMFA